MIEDILGVILVVRHASVAATDNGQKHTGSTGQPEYLPIQVTHRQLDIMNVSLFSSESSDLNLITCHMIR